MTTGTVTWFDSDRGYGFIAPDDGGAEVFVHYTALGGEAFKNLEPGERVSFGVTEGQRGGPQADAVRLLETLAEDADLIPPTDGLQPA